MTDSTNETDSTMSVVENHFETCDDAVITSISEKHNYADISRRDGLLWKDDTTPLLEEGIVVTGVRPVSENVHRMWFNTISVNSASPEY